MTASRSTVRSSTGSSQTSQSSARAAAIRLPERRLAAQLLGSRDQSGGQVRLATAVGNRAMMRIARELGTPPSAADGQQGPRILARTPRKPEPVEWRIIQKNLPDVEPGDSSILITAEPDPKYNCFAMAIGITDRQIGDVPIDPKALLAAYLEHGYHPVETGAEGAVDIWGGKNPDHLSEGEQVAVHASRPAPDAYGLPAGYYESKAGELFAFTHPRLALKSPLRALMWDVLGYGERIASVRRR